MREIFFILILMGLGTVPLQEVWGQEVPNPPSPPGLIFAPPSPPQPLLDTLSPPPKTKEIMAKEVQIEIQTPPGTKVSVPLATKTETNATQSDYRFLIPTVYRKATMTVEGPFGGKMIREINLEERRGPINITEKKIESHATEPDPAAMDSLPQICPRLVSKGEMAQNEITTRVHRNQILPTKSVYDGRRDLFSFAPQGKGDLLELQSAALSFDSEDSSILAGYNNRTGETVFEQGGGFYSNLHYVILPYHPQLENLYQQFEADWISLKKLEKSLRNEAPRGPARSQLIDKMKTFYETLHGKGEEIGPYQILFHYAFNTLPRIGRQDLEQTFPPPLAHGFIPGPFLGSRHWGYSLCEWGDTARHAPLQKLEYQHFALWHWSGTSRDEKIILLVIEGDDQINQNSGRRELTQKGLIRPNDYSDDLVGFFVISKRETLKKSALFSSPLQDLSLQLRTQ